MPRRNPLGSLRWLANAEDVRAFVAAHARLPRASSSSSVEERRLAQWLHYQRRSATRDHHTQEQQRRLAEIDGFNWTPREVRWHEQLDELKRFYTTWNRPPRYRSEDERERALSNWETKQRHLLRRGELSQSRVDALSGFTPHW
jgi:hypothetical protein